AVGGDGVREEHLGRRDRRWEEPTLGNLRPPLRMDLQGEPVGTDLATADPVAEPDADEPDAGARVTLIDAAMAPPADAAEVRVGVARMIYAACHDIPPCRRVRRRGLRAPVRGAGGSTRAGPSRLARLRPPLREGDVPGGLPRRGSTPSASG